MLKARKTDGVDRTLPYRDWHRTWGRGSYVHDIDQLEWRIINGKRVYIAVIELTAIMPYHQMPDALDEILKRIKEGPQGRVMVDVAEALEVPALVVAFTQDLETFYVYSLTHDSGWHQASKDEYRGWIDALENRKVQLQSGKQPVYAGAGA